MDKVIILELSTLLKPFVLYTHYVNTQHTYIMNFLLCSSALDTTFDIRVALKKLARPFQTAVHAKRTYRELRYLKHMNHENVRLFSACREMSGSIQSSLICSL